MLCSGHIKNIFCSAKNDKKVIVLKYKNENVVKEKKCVVLDVCENVYRPERGMDIKLNVKDVNNPNDNIELYVNDIDKFIVTNEIHI